ncbi:hypothetical protein A1L58_01000 [Shewanella baltica]|nr:hypothetical protein A1L58_01000 [Shewanella baltica]
MKLFYSLTRMTDQEVSFQLLFVINATFEQEKPDDSIKNHLQCKTCLTAQVPNTTALNSLSLNLNALI